MVKNANTSSFFRNASLSRGEFLTEGGGEQIHYQATPSNKILAYSEHSGTDHAMRFQRSTTENCSFFRNGLGEAIKRSRAGSPIRQAHEVHVQQELVTEAEDDFLRNETKTKIPGRQN